MLVYPEGAFTQPDVSYQVPSGSQERGSAAEVMSRHIDSLRTDVSGVKIKFTIISILDESSAIATGGNSTICLSGIATHNFVDDQIVEVAKPVIIDSPTRYTTIARSTKSVKTLRQLSDSEVKKLNAYTADQIAVSQSASAPAESAESK